MGVGSPAIYCGSYRLKFGVVSHTPILDHLIIDAGSSNAWVRAKRSYVKTNRCEDTQLSCKYRALTYSECADLATRARRVHRWRAGTHIIGIYLVVSDTGSLAGD